MCLVDPYRGVEKWYLVSKICEAIKFEAEKTTISKLAHHTQQIWYSRISSTFFRYSTFSTAQFIDDTDSLDLTVDICWLFYSKTDEKCKIEIPFLCSEVGENFTACVVSSEKASIIR